MPADGTGFTRRAAAAHRRNIRLLAVAYVAFVIAETSTWLAMLLFAHRRGGVGASGVAALVQLLPAALVAPLAAFAGDRFRRDRVVVVGHAAQALACALVATVMAMDASTVIVYGAGAATAIAMTFSRPAVGALLPRVASTPAALAAGNVMVGIAQSVGILAGPLFAGLLLLRVEPSGVFVFGAAMTALACVAASLVELVELDRVPIVGVVTLADVHVSTLAGLRHVRRAPGPRLVVLLLGLSAVVVGAADLAAVAVAIDVLGRGDFAVGAFTAVVGLGAVAGAASSRRLVTASRAGLVLAVGLVLDGVALIFVAHVGRTGTALLVFVVVGFGVGLTAVGGPALLHAITPDDVLARVFGAVEGLRMAALAVGSIAITALGRWVGATSAFALVGSSVIATVVGTATVLLRLEGRPGGAGVGRAGGVAAALARPAERGLSLVRSGEREPVAAAADGVVALVGTTSTAS